jgi:MFS transporter, DHA2 family, methylenomycin A resistance protein
VPNSLALPNHAYPEAKERGRAVAMWTGGASLALTAEPFVGGALIALRPARELLRVSKLLTA